MLYNSQINMNPLLEQMQININAMKDLIKRTKDPTERAKLKHELAIQNEVFERMKSGMLNAKF